MGYSQQSWFCPQCGNPNSSPSGFCTRCGCANPLRPSGNVQQRQPQSSPYPHYSQAGPQPQMQSYGTPVAQQYPGAMMMAPPKSRLVYILLGIFLGSLGIHNFYAGRNNTAVMQLLITVLTFWLGFPLVIVWIWAIIEIFTIDTDARGVRMS